MLEVTSLIGHGFRPRNRLTFEYLNGLHQKYQTRDFDAGMRGLLDASVRLGPRQYDILLFHFATECFEGGRLLADKASRLAERGSRLAEMIVNVRHPPKPVVLVEELSYLTSLCRSSEDALRFLTRIGVDRSLLDTAINLLGLSATHRTYRILDLSPMSRVFNLQSSTRGSDGKIHQKGRYGWSHLRPDLKNVSELSVATLPRAISFAESSLIVFGDSATMPFLHFKLAAENVVRRDALFIALGQDYILSRMPPASSAFVQNASVSLTSADSGHFGHFVIENLPRLRALVSRRDDLKRTTAVIDAVSTPYEPIIRSWSREITVKAVVSAEATTHETLLVARATCFAPSDLTHGADFYGYESNPTRFELPWELEETGRPPGTKTQSGRLALLRVGSGSAPYRRLINHSDLVETLVEYEFARLKKDALSFDTLEGHLRDSRFVVTEAGASIAANLFLTSLVGKSVLLLQHPHFRNQEQRMAGKLASLGAEVFIVPGKAAGPERQSDYKVETRHLRKCLDRMLS